MENEIRYYLKQIKGAMAPISEDEQKFYEENEEATKRVPFEPAYIVTAVKLPTGAIELAVNTQNIESKIDYILEAYDQDMQLKTNNTIVMQNIMVV